VTQQYKWIQNFSKKFYDFNNVYSNGEKIFAVIENGGNTKIAAFNKLDGSVVWERELEEYTTSFHFYNSNIILTTDLGGLSKASIISLSQNSGSKVWQRDFPWYNNMDSVSIDFGDDQTYYKNYLFSPQCDNLLIVDLDNGSVFFNKQAAFRNGCLQGKISINEQQAWFYANDGYYANCYKLPTGLKFK
jgi:hypothetical protein